MFHFSLQILFATFLLNFVLNVYSYACRSSGCVSITVVPF